MRPYGPHQKIKTSLDKEEVLELVDKLKDIETLLTGIDVSVLIDNEAVDDVTVEVVVFSKVRVIQCLKLLGAKHNPLKQNVRKADVL